MRGINKVVLLGRLGTLELTGDVLKSEISIDVTLPGMTIFQHFLCEVRGRLAQKSFNELTAGITVYIEGHLEPVVGGSIVVVDTLQVL